MLNTKSIIKIILSIGIMVLLIFPFSALGLRMPQLFVNEKIVIDIRYLISGVLFLGYILILFFENKKQNKDFDGAINSALFNSILIILAAQGFIHPIIAVSIVARDIIVDKINLKVNSLDAFKNICLTFGILLTLFYNLPFELFNFRVADFLLILSAVLSILSTLKYSK